jgi:hypothetical protein
MSSKKCSKQPKIVQEEIVEDEPEVKKSKKQSKKETTMVEPIKVKKSMNKVVEDEVETPKKKGKKSKKDSEDSGDEVVVITKKSNPWIEYVAKFKLKHSELSHKEALVEASKKYKLLKK